MSTDTVRAGAADEAAERRREQRGWYFHDWACSVYSASVLTVFLGPYLTSVAKSAADADGYVHPLGVPVRAGSFFAYSVSASVVLSILVMPLAGAAADRGGRKKPLLALCAYLGATATTGMFFLDGSQELGLSQSTLISAVLLVQVLAVGGALAMGRLARTYGAKRTILGSLVAWTVTVGAGYFLPAGAPVGFFLLAGCIGLVLGGSQALSRSLFSHLVPPGKEAEYFSAYEMSDRGMSWLGPLLFGLTYQLSGSYRDAILSLVTFFAIGFVLLARVPVRQAVRDAGNPVPERI